MVLTAGRDVAAAVQAWGESFEDALARSDEDLLNELFLEESYLRDCGAFTWDWRQFWGREAISGLVFGLDTNRPRALRISPDWPEPTITEDDEPTVVAFFDYETEWGAGLLLLNGVIDPEAAHGFKARILVTRLEQVEAGQRADPDPLGHRPDGSGEPWEQYRARKREKLDHDPDVLIVGAGHSGLMIAAHLDQMGISSLIVEKHPRVGDNWRTRYSSLALHNPSGQNSFPFLPFPPHMPEYWPKDVVADWLETYARYLDLNVWTSTELLKGSYDSDERRWEATLRTADGGTRILHPKHIVEATGVTGGRPRIPYLEGLDSYTGALVHSHDFAGAENYPNVRSAIVIGVGSSGHDISLALHKQGVDVTMVQRGPTVIVDLETANKSYGDEYFDGVTPSHIPDFRRSPGFVAPLRLSKQRAYHQESKKVDAELLDGLQRAGLQMWDGTDDAGWISEFLHHGGGYYINVGASNAIVEGGISILQAERIVRFTEQGAQLDDDSVLKADLIVLATGYENRVVDIEERFGTAVAERVGPVAKIDADGEWTNVYRPTAQRGLWFSGGGIAYVRRGARVLALLIEADLAGLIPDEVFDRLARDRSEAAASLA